VENAQNLEALSELLLALAMVFSFIFMLWLRRTTPSRSEVSAAIKASIDSLTEKLGAADRSALEALGRVARVEVTIDRHATKDDVSEILQALTRQDGDRRTLGAEVRGMREGFVRIEQQLDMLMQEALHK
jgi:hypothetical protein